MSKITINTDDYPIIILQKESGAPKIYKNGELKDVSHMEACYRPSGKKKKLYYKFGYGSNQTELDTKELMSIDYGKMIRDQLDKS